MDPGTDFSRLRFYRAPWEPPPVQALPERMKVSPPPLARVPFRVSVQQRYWLGPAPDFFLFLGYVALGGGLRDVQQVDWAAGPGFPSTPGSWPAPVDPKYQAQPPRWEYPPLRVDLVPAADRDGARK
jgi:hypothetical protein